MYEDLVKRLREDATIADSGNEISFSLFAEKVYEKYPKDPDIWKLLQEVVAMHQDLEKCKKDIETIGKAISPMLMAEVICRMRKEE